MRYAQETTVPVDRSRMIIINETTRMKLESRELKQKPPEGLALRYTEVRGRK